MSNERFGQIALWLVVIAGCGCRLAQYLADPSYWHDEALVVLNVMHKSAPQLLGRLDYAQAAPPLFLMAQRAMFLAFGPGEYALRFVSLICGLASLCMFAWLCRRLLPGVIVPWVVAFFAFSDKLIWHAAEVKPYGGDALIAVILFFLALAPPVRLKGAKDQSGADRGAASRFMAISIFSAVALWFSFPTSILFGSLSLLFLPRLLRQGTRGGVIYFVGYALVGASFLLLYHFSIKPQHVDYLSSYWIDDFPNYAHPLRIPFWLAGELYSLCNHPYRSLGAIVAPLAILGIFGWRRRGRMDVAAACLLPIGLAIVAAFARQYPFNGDRLSVYLIPGLFLLCGGGLMLLRDMCLDAGPNALKFAWVLPAFAIAGRGLGEASYRVIAPRSRSGIRPAVAFARAHRQPGEGLYLVGEPDEKSLSYATRLSLELLCYWPNPPAPWHAGMPDKLSTIPERRFWVVIATLPRHGTSKLSPLVKQLAPIAREKERFLTPGGGGAAVLFERIKPR
ncbi:MAG TPA: hypothetical protein VFC78_18865 [Tepidisphaeraceae bacterium]|nr:hypothetical protein [Tepidisphaeraceae bacterium]